MKVSEFLQTSNISPFILGAFYGRYEITSDLKFIYTYSKYKEGSIYTNHELFIQSKIDYLQQLNEISKPFTYWEKGSKYFSNTDIVFALENDLELNATSFFNRLNTKIYNSDFIYEEELTEDKKMFIRGFSELRASLDRNRNLLAMDYVYNNKQEVKRVRLLIDYLNVPVHVVNYNFREFQEDYRKGKKRATQFRFNINWYVTNIGLINNFRIAVFESNFYFEEKIKLGLITYYKCPQPLRSNNTTFENRLAYYANNVHGKKLSKTDLVDFQKLIGILPANDNFKRDISIVNYIRYNTPDICVCCCDDYDIKDRSYIERNTGRYHFEIHHVISVGKVKELDDVDNLAKICPTCHDLLKRGSADEKTQKEAINKILNHKDNILDFCKSYFDEEDKEKVIDLIWKALK